MLAFRPSHTLYSFFNRTPSVAASDRLTIVEQSQLGYLFFRASTYFRFWSKPTQNVAQIILYYHVTKQFLDGLNWLMTCFRFQNIFCRNSCFRFWWKTYTKCCSNNYVISGVKRISSPVLCFDQVLLISGYDLENGRMLCKQNY